MCKRAKLCDQPRGIALEPRSLFLYVTSASSSVTEGATLPRVLSLAAQSRSKLDTIIIHTQ
jgi:hypothetical protein